MTEKLRVKLFPKQMRFVESEAPFSLFLGGVGSGKTRAGCAKAVQYAVRYPGSLGMVTAPTYPMLQDATLRTLLELLPLGSYELDKSRMILSLHNGSEMLLRSTDDPERLRGPNLAWVYMDEGSLSPAEAFKILQGRLRQPGFPAQLWVTTTPKGFNWVYQEFAAQPRADYHWIKVSARENPYLPSGFVQKLQESYLGDFALQEIEGEFVLLGGLGFFSAESLRSMLDDCREPLETARGLVRIWRKPVVAAKYLGFGDVCWGHASAYSCFVLADWATGEQVAEIYGRPEHDEYAREIADLTTLYNRAYFGVEANGESVERSGLNVINKLVALGVGDRMYHHGEKWRENERERGWLTTGVTRPLMLGDLEEMVRLRGVIPRCNEGVSEMMSFVRNEKGRPEAVEGAFADHVMAWAGLAYLRAHNLATWYAEKRREPVYEGRSY